MLGRQYRGNQRKIPEDFNSKIYQPNPDGNSRMLIIESEEQIQPAFNIQVKW